MQQIVIVLLFGTLWCSTWYAGMAQSIATKESMIASTITRVLPAEYAAYKRALSGDNGRNDARASLLLLSQAQEALSRRESSPDRRRDDFDAYRAVWLLCLRLRQASRDHAAQQLVLDEWNNCLKKDGDPISAQLYALVEQWDRELLTSEFWQLLKETTNPQTLSAICVVLYNRGDKGDVERLVKKRDSGIDLHSQQIIQNGINWLKHRLKADATDPGPAAMGPRPDYPTFNDK